MLHEHVGIRLKLEDKELLQRVCEDRGEDISTFVRRLIRMELARLSFYPENVKKALGVTSSVTSASIDPGDQT